MTLDECIVLEELSSIMDVDGISDQEVDYNQGVYSASFSVVLCKAEDELFEDLVKMGNRRANLFKKRMGHPQVELTLDDDTKELFFFDVKVKGKDIKDLVSKAVDAAVDVLANGTSA